MSGTTNPEVSPLHWHLKREVHVGHIVTTLVVAVGALTYMQGLERRIALLEAAQVAARERDREQDQALHRVVDVIDRRLNRIDDKLGALLELRNGAGGEPSRKAREDTHDRR